jgi:hypothetical protein
MDLDMLKAIAVFANDAANGTFLLAATVIVLIMAAVAVVWMRDRVRKMRQQRADLALWNAEVVTQAGHDAIHRDPVDDFIENALRWERDQKRLRDADDVYDVHGGDDDD